MYELVYNTMVNTPLELGNVANICARHCSMTPIPCPPNFLDVVHLDICYGDYKAMWGTKYAILLVDHATFSWVFALWSLNHKEIMSILQQFVVDAGASPHHVYTDFDPNFPEVKFPYGFVNKGPESELSCYQQYRMYA